MSEFDTGTPQGASVVVEGQHDHQPDIPGCPPSERSPAVQPTTTAEVVRRTTSKPNCVWRRLLRLFTT